ncbi:MAG TPA: hypothetical protein VGM37_16275 [Armatimonadota bacterium]
MKRIGYLFGVMAATVATLAAAGGARAQGQWPGLVQVAPGIWQPAADLSGGMVEVAQGVFRPASSVSGPLVEVAPGVWQPSMASLTPPPPRAFTARVGGSFALNQTDEVADSDTVTRGQYSADGVAISFTPTDGSGPLRLVGRVTVDTVTTATTEGAGTISGTMKFTCRIGSTVVDVITAQLSGAYGEGAKPLQATGELNIPATNPGEQAVYGAVTATLASDAGLQTTLAGLANVELQ